ncbi:MAG TPA: YwiC-like family protein [Terriglobia bacterium]|nr:YwiC-like family protein [Terriglobia bacterium]
MTSPSPTMPSANARRIGLLIWPREHGAWGMLLVPLVTGAAAGFRTGRSLAGLFLFVLAALALFCLRTPAEALLQTTPWRASSEREKGAVYISIAVYLSVATAALGLLLIWKGDYLLLPLGGMAFLFFLAQAGIKKLGRENRVLGQLIGSAGLTSTAAGGYYVVSGRLDETALVAWGLNWLFAANQIQYVQLRIQSAQAKFRGEKLLRGGNFLMGQAVTIILLFVAWLRGDIHPWLSLAFVPVFYRGTAWFFKKPAPLRIHRLGLSELAHAIIFGVLLILAVYLSAV